MIELNNITIKFGKKTILNDVTLKIDKDITILGVNGSGKSTLAKTICGIIQHSGNIKINNKNIQTTPPKELAKEITYIPAKLENADDFITVYEFVLLGRFAYKENFFQYSKEDRTKADEALKLFDITDLKEHQLNSLSSGESALVLMAQALCSDTKIIIFDEPTANLDPKNSKTIALHIKNLKKTKQVILITHDLNLAKFTKSEVAFIKDRKILHYKDDFFKDDVLKKLYDVEFDSMVVKYD